MEDKPSSKRVAACRGPCLVASTAILVAGVAVLGHLPLAGQSDRTLQVSVGTHALTVPWYVKPLAYRFDPTVMVGTDWVLRSGEPWKLSFGINLGFFRDHWWMTGLSVEPEVRVARSIPGGLQADLGLGLGYMHYFWRRNTLKLEDGKYVAATDWGRPSLIVPLSFTVAYRGDPDHPLSVAPFVSARWGVQALFLSEAPVMTHLSLLGGVRIRRGSGGGGR